MDTLAFDLATEWEEAPRPGLPLRGEEGSSDDLFKIVR